MLQIDGLKLKKQRKAKNITQERLEEKSLISLSTLKRAENEDKIEEKNLKILEKLGFNTEELLIKEEIDLENNEKGREVKMNLSSKFLNSIEKEAINSTPMDWLIEKAKKSVQSIQNSPSGVKCSFKLGFDLGIKDSAYHFTFDDFC